VRIIAATNRNLQNEIKTGNFREDLFYRIAAFQIALPALRERVCDIELFAYHFLQMFSAKANKRVEKFSDDFISALKQYQWNGNIRELRNVIERCVIMANGIVITTDLLPVEIKQSAFPSTKDNVISSFKLAHAEKTHIQKVLNYTNGNKTKTAELLGIALTTLYRKIAEYKIE
jgi:transcriptional regulator with PAS, ATPase and Fis domain